MKNFQKLHEAYEQVVKEDTKDLEQRMRLEQKIRAAYTKWLGDAKNAVTPGKGGAARVDDTDRSYAAALTACANEIKSILGE